MKWSLEFQENMIKAHADLIDRYFKENHEDSQQYFNMIISELEAFSDVTNSYVLICKQQEVFKQFAPRFLKVHEGFNKLVSETREKCKQHGIEIN